MASNKQNAKTGYKIVISVSLLLIIGCIAPLLIIHFKTAYPHWQPLALEIIGLGGLSLIFGRLIVEKLV